MGATLRLLGYVRVSRVGGREGEGYIAPKVQRQSIESYATDLGGQIADEDWYEDENFSGGNTERPGFQEAMNRVIDGEAGGVVVAAIDRFARSTADGAACVEQILDAGGVFASCQERIDPKTPTGKYMLNSFFNNAELTLNLNKAQWAVSKDLAIGRGAFVGPTPVGYRRREDGTLEEHPEHGPIVREAFERAARRDTQAAIDYLGEQGLTHKRKGKQVAYVWTPSRVRRLLRSRAYVGEARYGERKYEIPALVDRATWRRAQPPDERPRRKAAAAFPLSGWATCAQCGEPLVGGRAGQGLRTYRCRASLRSWKGERCVKPTHASADGLEQLLVGYLHDVVMRGEYPAPVEIGDDSAKLREADATFERTEQELDDFAGDDEARRKLGDARWHAALDKYIARRDSAAAEVRELTKASATRLVDVPGYFKTIGVTEDGEWSEAGMTGDELRQVLQAAYGEVSVRRGREPIYERVRADLRDAPATATTDALVKVAKGRA